MGLRLAICAGLLGVLPAAAAETPMPILGAPQISGQAFAGQMSDNEWGDFFTYDDTIGFFDAYTIGGGVQLEWPVWRVGYAGIEAQALLWVGDQNHLELTVPIFIRTPRPNPVWLPSIAYGLGLSYATEPSEVEIARTGSSTELLAHWFVELEFGNSETNYRPYLRLHHRSDNAGMFGADTGSNAILLGLRRSF